MDLQHKEPSNIKTQVIHGHFDSEKTTSTLLLYGLFATLPRASCTGKGKKYANGGSRHLRLYHEPCLLQSSWFIYARFGACLLAAPPNPSQILLRCQGRSFCERLG